GLPVEQLAQVAENARDRVLAAVGLVGGDGAALEQPQQAERAIRSRQPGLRTGAIRRTHAAALRPLRPPLFVPHSGRRRSPFRCRARASALSPQPARPIAARARLRSRPAGCAPEPARSCAVPAAPIGGWGAMSREFDPDETADDQSELAFAPAR